MNPLRAVDKPEGLLSIEDAATWLHVSYSTVTRLMRAGQLPYCRVAGLRRIDINDLRGYVAAQQQALQPARVTRVG